jgi:SulP family sulfate permease
MPHWPPKWIRHYQSEWLSGDLLAGLIVTVILIPQSLSYALLAGLPLEMGLYASALPLILYALCGSSATLSVGPVAITALMTGSALAPLAQPGSAEAVRLAMVLATLCGAFLVLFAALRLGRLSHFLSDPVLNGFLTAAAILIAVSQLKPLLGLRFQARGSLTPCSDFISMLRRSRRLRQCSAWALSGACWQAG